MEKTFGQRVGAVSSEIPVVLNTINNELRNQMWNSYFICFVVPFKDTASNFGKTALYHDLTDFYTFCWIHFFCKSLDEFSDGFRYQDFVKNFFQKGNWYKIYEFIEFILNIERKKFQFVFRGVEEFVQFTNSMLIKYNSGYRIVENKLVPITNEAEINEINTLSKESDKHSQLLGVSTHLKSAIEFISDKENPDYRNSIKESISMVEVISRIIEPTENSLGKALKKLGDNGRINSVLKIGFEKLYAYTNGENGIRHAMMDEENISLEDARYFLVSCSAFTNYLIEKAKKEKILE